MARHTFGQTPTDWTMTISAGGVITAVGAVEVTFWSQPIGGVQYTDLLDAAGAAVTSVLSADGTGTLPLGTIPQFSGPDAVTDMWADAGGGARFKMVATDLGNVITDLSATVAELQETVELLQNSGGVLRYDTVTLSWPARPVDSRLYWWVGPTAPALIPDGDLFVDTEP